MYVAVTERQATPTQVFSYGIVYLHFYEIKIENFQFCTEYSSTTLGVKNSVEIALSLMVSEILIFLVFRKNSRWLPKVAKIEFFQFHIEYSATTLRVKNSVEIALSLTVSEILTFLVFPAKIQDGRQKWRKLKFFNFV